MPLPTHILWFTSDLTGLFLLLVHLVVLLSLLCVAVPLFPSHPQNYMSLQISLSSELQPSSIPADESSSDMLVIVDEPVSSAQQSRATNSPASIAGSVSDTMNGGYPRHFCNNIWTHFIQLWKKLRDHFRIIIDSICLIIIGTPFESIVHLFFYIFFCKLLIMCLQNVKL